MFYYYDKKNKHFFRTATEIMSEDFEVATESRFKNQREVRKLKIELASYDYIGTKIAMGVATKEDYAKEIAYTETLRERIRELEK